MSETKTNKPTSKQAPAIRVETREQKISTTFNKSMNAMRTMIYFFGIIVILIVIGAFAFVYQANDHAQSRAFVVTDYGTLYAKNSMNEDPKSRKIEIESHIRIFASNMFAFDDKTYQEHVEKGLQLIGDNGKEILGNYNENQMYNKLVTTNTVVNVYIDSVWVNVNKKPYQARMFARQEFDNSLGRKQAWLWADMVLKDVSRSAVNVHGLKIENYVPIRKGFIQ